MIPKLKEVRAVGFDLDGTLYRLTSEMNDRIRTRVAQRILEKRPELKDLRMAREYFEEKYEKIQSATKILSELGYKNAPQIMDECLSTADVVDLIPTNPELANLIQQISSKYETNLLTSSPEHLSISKLEKIGIDPHIFSHTVFSDTLGTRMKMDGTAFDQLLSLSLFPAPEHVYIGDRSASDILPARSKGMKTIAVWSNIPEADISILDINYIGDILL